MTSIPTYYFMGLEVRSTLNISVRNGGGLFRLFPCPKMLNHVFDKRICTCHMSTHVRMLMLNDVHLSSYYNLRFSRMLRSMPPTPWWETHGLVRPQFFLYIVTSCFKGSTSKIFATSSRDLSIEKQDHVGNVSGVCRRIKGFCSFAKKLWNLLFSNGESPNIVDRSKGRAAIGVVLFRERHSFQGSKPRSVVQWVGGRVLSTIS